MSTVLLDDPIQAICEQAEAATIAYRQLVVDLVSGQPIDQETIGRTLLAAGRSAAHLTADILRVQERRQLAEQLTQGRDFAAQRRKLTAEIQAILDRADAERKEHERRLQALEQEIYAKRHEGEDLGYEERELTVARQTLARTCDPAINAEITRLQARRERLNGTIETQRATLGMLERVEGEVAEIEGDLELVRTSRHPSRHVDRAGDLVEPDWYRAAAYQPGATIEKIIAAGEQQLARRKSQLAPIGGVRDALASAERERGEVLAQIDRLEASKLNLANFALYD